MLATTLSPFVLYMLLIILFIIEVALLLSGFCSMSGKKRGKGIFKVEKVRAKVLGDVVVVDQIKRG